MKRMMFVLYLTNQINASFLLDAWPIMFLSLKYMLKIRPFCSSAVSLRLYWGYGDMGMGKGFGFLNQPKTTLSAAKRTFSSDSPNPLFIMLYRISLIYAINLHINSLKNSDFSYCITRKLKLLSFICF